MSLAMPWALLGWVLLPLVWWLHRRLRRPRDVSLPSLMFLKDEAETRALPRGRTLDAELFLALSAVALLTLAAAGPLVVRARAHREVQVVVSGGTPATMRGYTQRVEAVLADIRAGLEPEDELHVRYEPAPPQRGVFVPRPTPNALLAAAHAGRRSLRIVVSDTAAPAETGEVHWVSVGEPGTENIGLVAVSVKEEGGRMSVFFTVANHGDSPREVRVGASSDVAGDDGPRASGLTTLKLGRRGLASGVQTIGGHPKRISVDLRDASGMDLDDALEADDRVELSRVSLSVYLHPELPDLQAPLRDALLAVLGRGGFSEVSQAAASEADLAFVPVWAPLPGKAWILALQPTVQGDPVDRAPAGANPLGRDPLVRDLSAAGVDLVYAPGAAERRAGEDLLLGRVATRTWPVVLRNGRRIRLAPDPLRGEPAPVKTPFWPLLIENLIRRAGGVDLGRGGGVGAAYRARGLLDPTSTRPGRARAAYDPTRIGAAAPSVPAKARPLMGICILGALVCLLLLWGAPRLRRRLSAHGRSPMPVRAR